jgi:hypothetical protein
MTRAPKLPDLQMNLQLLDPSTRATIPSGKQEELTQALMELLIQAAQKTTEHGKTESRGGRSESETHS